MSKTTECDNSNIGSLNATQFVELHELDEQIKSLVLLTLLQ